MFLARYKEGSSSSDKTLSSPHWDQQDQESIPSPPAVATTTTLSTNLTSAVTKPTQQRIKVQAKGVERKSLGLQELLSSFVIGTSTLVTKILIGAYSRLKRWINFSLEAVLTAGAIKPIGYCSNLKPSKVTLALPDAIPSDQLAWQKCVISPSSSSTVLQDCGCIAVSNQDFFVNILIRAQKRCASEVEDFNLELQPIKQGKYKSKFYKTDKGMDFLRRKRAAATRKAAAAAATTVDRNDADSDQAAGPSSYHWNCATAAQKAEGAEVVATPTNNLLLRNSSLRVARNVREYNGQAGRESRDYGRRLSIDLQRQEQQQQQQPEQQRYSYTIFPGAAADTAAAAAATSVEASSETRATFSERQSSQRDEHGNPQTSGSHFKCNNNSDNNSKINDNNNTFTATATSTRAALATPAPSIASLIKAFQRDHEQQQQQQQQQQQKPPKDAMQFNANPKHAASRVEANDVHTNDSSGQRAEVPRRAPMVLMSRADLSQLTDQIALSMNKMKHLEEQVRVIPELQKRLDHMMISDCNSSTSSSVKDFNQNVSHNSAPGARFATDHISNTNINRNTSIITSPNQHFDCNNINNNNYHHYQHSQISIGSGGEPTTRGFQTGGVHPSLQRHHNSFRHLSSSSANNRGDRCTGNYVNNNSHIVGNQTSACRSTNSLGTRPMQNQQQSPFSTTKGTFNLANHHIGAQSGVESSSTPFANSGNVSQVAGGQSFRSLTSIPVIRAGRSENLSGGGGGCSSSSTDNHLLESSSPKIEYEDLINDLISLSYSVNYLSSTSETSSNRSQGAGTSVGKMQSGSNKNTGPPHDGQHVQQQKQEQYITSNLTTSAPLVNQLYHLSNNNNHSTMSIGSNSNNNNPSTTNRQPVQLSNSHNSNSHSRFQSTSSSSSSYHNAKTCTGSMSLQTTPVKTRRLDCGCSTIREHLRYNTISREQRLNNNNNNNHTKSNQLTSSVTTINSNGGSSTNVAATISPPPFKIDASTNTELSMNDIITKDELSSMMTNLQKTYSTLSSINSHNETNKSQFKSIFRKSSSLESDSTSDSMSGPKSSSPLESRSESCDAEDDEPEASHHGDGVQNGDILMDDDDNEHENNSSRENTASDEGEANELGHNEDEEEEDCDLETNAGSTNNDEPFSIGSSYQDPSDFEEYCAYEESLDRRSKDFMSQSAKIPNDLRFALIRLDEFIKRKRPHHELEASSGCIEIIRKEWFEVAAIKESQAEKVKLYVNYFESFTKQLLNTVVNLADSAGNTAMHYAASYYKLDIVAALLDTKVCDVNCRNRAGYTPIMLLALADIKDLREQEIARQLFTMGDVNIKARCNGQTALMLASSHGRITTCKLLLESGADPSLQDNDGSTALMCGSELGNEEVIRCLLAHKLTDPNAIDNDGLDALKIAMNNGHKNIGLILYAAKNVPRMLRSSISGHSNQAPSSNYLGASMRRSRGKLATNFVRRADSLLSSRGGRPARPSGI